ncbi:helix-turn-helix domain-containing protein [Nocardia sp. NPDC050435]|uniref:AraC family transcriptional regulator n=1 Tax=Nocardia sp. NPDC050435 TaxID=3155040 RepID=UPI0033C98B2E
MGCAGGETAVWEVRRPPRPRLPGVRMAGFRDRGATPEGHRAIPHPAVTLLLEFGSSTPLVDTTTGARRAGSLVAAAGPAALWVHGDQVECIQIRLSPVVARAILGVSPAELEGAVVPLDELWGREARRICEQLSETGSWAGRFALTEALLARRRSTATVDPEIAWCWRQLTRSRGRIRVGTLAADVGWSRKRLWSRFDAQLGMPPKRAAGLIRFDHAAHLLAAGMGAARAAAESGYADQPHLHRDVAAFTGLTPSALAREPWLAVDDLAWL